MKTRIWGVGCRAEQLAATDNQSLADNQKGRKVN